MIGIWEGIGEGITKCRRGFFEGDTVFGQIGRSFILIPGKPHVRNIAALRFLLPLNHRPNAGIQLRRAISSQAERKEVT